MQLKSKLVVPFMMLCALPVMAQQVNMGIVKEKIPTYKIGNPEVDPIFFTGRVYQGAEGYIYPYPLYDVLTEEKVNHEYEILRLDNQYINIGVLPVAVSYRLLTLPTITTSSIPRQESNQL